MAQECVEIKGINVEAWRNGLARQNAGKACLNNLIGAVELIARHEGDVNMREVLFVKGVRAGFNENGTAQRKELQNNKYVVVEVTPCKGWFHGFFQEGCEGDGLEPAAVIEMENGITCTVGANQIKFVQPGQKETKENG